MEVSKKMGLVFRVFRVQGSGFRHGQGLRVSHDLGFRV